MKSAQEKPIEPPRIRRDSGRRLFFVINQDPMDGSAHAIYCFRHAWWLAKTAPDCEIDLVVPGKADAAVALRHFDLEALPNFRIVALPAVRKPRHGRGLTINLVFHLAVASYLRRHAADGDFLLSGSFTKLFAFLQRRTELRKRLRFIYEVHQLAVVDDARSSKKAEAEFTMLKGNDALITSSAALDRILRRHGVKAAIHDGGLACGFDPADFPARPAAKPFVLGYIGSVYREQGIEWLIRHWTDIAATQREPVTLNIAGGSQAEVRRLREIAGRASTAEGLSLSGFVPPSQLGSWIQNVDALVIPSLPEGRMPFVAITKAYDYLGLNRPVLAANLPTICEVMRTGVDAVLFHAGEWRSMADKLGRLVSDSALRHRLTRNAASRAKEFSWGERNGRIWRFLNSTFPRGLEAG